MSMSTKKSSMNTGTYTMSTTSMRHLIQLMNRIPIGMCTIRSYTNTSTIQTHTIGMITQADLGALRSLNRSFERLVVRPVQMIPMRSWPLARHCCRR